MTSPNISVLMPARNAGKFLRESLDSVLAQTAPDFELIVCDDASSDNSGEILAGYAARDSRVKVLRNEKNLGIARTRNRLLAAMDPGCAYVALMDSDDVCFPDRLERQRAFLEAHPEIGAVGSALEIIDENSRNTGFRSYPTSPEEIRRIMPGRNVMAQPAMMLRRAAVESTGLYNPECVCCSDYEYWLRMLEKFDFANLPEPVLRYRMSSAQCKQSKLRLSLKTTLKIQADYRRRTGASFWRALPRSLAGRLLLCLPSAVILKLFELTAYRKNGR